jgi:hypothetical protein
MLIALHGVIGADADDDEDEADQHACSSADKHIEFVPRGHDCLQDAALIRAWGVGWRKGSLTPLKAPLRLLRRELWFLERERLPLSKLSFNGSCVTDDAGARSVACRRCCA